MRIWILIVISLWKNISHCSSNLAKMFKNEWWSPFDLTDQRVVPFPLPSPFHISSIRRYEWKLRSIVEISVGTFQMTLFQFFYSNSKFFRIFPSKNNNFCKFFDSSLISFWNESKLLPVFDLALSIHIRDRIDRKTKTIKYLFHLCAKKIANFFRNCNQNGEIEEETEVYEKPRCYRAVSKINRACLV